GGWIKIEKQDTNGVWSDVTQTILNYGFGAPNLDGMGCSDPTPNAIIRLQRLRDNGNALLTQCPIGDSKNSYEWWPNVLYDAREAVQRDDDYPQTLTPNTPLTFNGVMHYVTLDVRNLAKYFVGTAAPYAANGNGANAKTDISGYTVYFSD